MTEQQFKPGDRVCDTRGGPIGIIESVHISYSVLWDGVSPSHVELGHRLEPYCDACRNTQEIVVSNDVGDDVDVACPVCQPHDHEFYEGSCIICEIKSDEVV